MLLHHLLVQLYSNYNTNRAVPATRLESEAGLPKRAIAIIGLRPTKRKGNVNVNDINNGSNNYMGGRRLQLTHTTRQQLWRPDAHQADDL
eukprot:6183437-Amphidinium_carterae.2